MDAKGSSELVRCTGIRKKASSRSLAASVAGRLGSTRPAVNAFQRAESSEGTSLLDCIRSHDYSV